MHRIGVGSPHNVYGNFRTGITGQFDAAIVGDALCEINAGLANAARLVAGQGNQRRVVADEWIFRVHHDRIYRANRIPSARSDTAPAWKSATRATIGIFRDSVRNIVIEFTVIEHLAPQAAINESADM